MAWTKTKTTIVAGVLLAAIIIIVIYQRHRYPWQVADARGEILDKVEPQVKIVPTKFSPSGGYTGRNGRYLGMGQSINTLLGLAYNGSRYRMVFDAKLPEGYYDFIASLPEGNQEALRREIETQFNLTAKTEKLKTNVLLLTVKHRNAPGLKARETNSEVCNMETKAGHYYCDNGLISYLAQYCENYFEIPVIDKTGLAGKYDISFKWNEQDWQHHNPDAFRKVLLDELGLELVPGRETIDMLVVDKAH
jgi:uncharacterized protein (TIGR03435 family)